MTKEGARKLAMKIEEQGYQTELRSYHQWDNLQTAHYDLLVTDHVTGYTMVIESPEDWGERERLSELYS